MFQIAVRGLHDEKYYVLPTGPYKTQEEGKQAVTRFLVQVRPGGELIQPEEFEIIPVSAQE